jgi:hypothetical protein
MQHFKKERPMRFLRMKVLGEIIPAQILSDSSSGYKISIWIPEHTSVHDGRLIPGARKIKHIFQDDPRIESVDDKYDPSWEGDVVDLFIAQEELILKQSG